MREGLTGWSVCPCASKALPCDLCHSWTPLPQGGVFQGIMGGQGLWELVVLAPLCARTPGPSAGAVSRCLGWEGVGRPCCSISGRPLGSVSSAEGSAPLPLRLPGFPAERFGASQASYFMCMF